ncbi:MAG: glycosyltransferase family 1 protein [Clostridia bacterium]
MPKRILHIIGRMHMGGSETFLMNIYRNIDRKKIQFDFIVHTKEICEYDKEIEELGGRIYRIPPISKHPIKNMKAIRDILKNNEYQYDTIHRHTNLSIVFTDLMIAKKMGIKNRYVHAHSNQSQKAKFIHKLCRPILNHLATKKFACSQAAAEWLFGKKEARNTQIIYNAIDVDKFLYSEEIREEIRQVNGASDKFVIGNVGRFERAKNHMFIIDIFGEIVRQNENFELWLVGDGSLKSDIQKKVESLGIEKKVKFFGIRKDVNRIIQGMDIFLFPSIYEGLGISFIEAQISGIKCYVSEAIQREAIITNNVKRIYLKEGKEKWALKILSENLKYDRKIESTSNKVRQFRVENLVNIFEKIYLGEKNET